MAFPSPPPTRGVNPCRQTVTATETPGNNTVHCCARITGIGSLCPSLASSSPDATATALVSQFDTVWEGEGGNALGGESRSLGTDSLAD